MLGPDNYITAHSFFMLAYIYIDQQKYEQAEPLYQRTLKIFENTLPPDHLYIAGRLEDYASLLRNMNRTTEAEPLEERARAIRANHST